MAVDFNSDGGKGKVQPVYLRLSDGPLLSIFPTNYNQKNHCSLLGSPSESGQMQYDNKVIQPSTVQFTGIVKNANKRDIIRIRTMIKSFKLQKIKCQFQTKAGKIDNMIIESIEEIGEPNRYDAMEIKVSLLEYLEHNQAKKK